MTRTKIESILEVITGEIYEYIYIFVEEMFVLDPCMKGAIDILLSPFNRWQKNTKWSTSLERGSYYCITVKSNFPLVPFRYVRGFFPPAFIICSLSSPKTVPACKAEVLGPERRSQSALIWGSELEVPAADDTQGSASYSATSQQGHPPDHLWSINYSNTGTHCL